MYYLQSRYYDAKICRFINADVFISTGQGLTGYNMFAYCGNNPVNRVDPTGESFISSLELIVRTATNGIMLSCCSIKEFIKQRKQKAINVANDAQLIERRDENGEYITIDIYVNTKYTKDSVGIFEYGFYYDALYENYLQKAELLGISKDNLMTKDHIKWELQVHMVGQLLGHPSADPANLNREENWLTIIRRLF